MPVIPLLTEAKGAFGAVAAVMAETFMLLPRMAAAVPNTPDVLDTSRYAGPFQAIFFNPAAQPDIPNSYDKQVFRPGTAASKPRIEFDPLQIQNLDIQAKDLITQSLNGLTWRIAAIHAKKTGILVADLNLIG